MWLRTDDTRHVEIVGTFIHFASTDEAERLFEAPEGYSLPTAGVDPMLVVQSNVRAKSS